MKGFTRVLFVALLAMSSPAFGQELDPRVEHLRDRILDRVPDIPSAARGLGRHEARQDYALRHAQAIVGAADTYQEEWEGFAEQGGWTSFDPHEDLPLLIAAIAYRESSFQPVIRLDDNTRVYSVRDMTGTIRVADMRRRMQRNRPRGDMGFMQVRVPGSPATACGATREDMQRLLDDHAFNYRVGTCILTRSLAAYIEDYAQSSRRRMRHGQRPAHIIRFYLDNPDLQDLAVIERYNWGNRDLYEHERGAGYSQRVLREFLFFRGTNDDPSS